VDGDHFAGVAGDAAVGEEVGRVGEDEVDGIFRDGGEDFEAVALVKAEVVLGVVERRGGQVGSVAVRRRRDGFGHFGPTEHGAQAEVPVLPGSDRSSSGDR
jgi:hypothetical protein